MPKLVLVSGATGLVGRALVTALRARGDRVRTLVRRAPSGPDEARFDPTAASAYQVEPSAFDGVDAVVHLAGENIGRARWTDAHKRAVMDSRVLGTRALVRGALEARERGGGPSHFLCASAVGYYGVRSEPVDETSSAGSGFLAEVCTAWEGELAPLVGSGIRTNAARFGVVLSADGGALAGMRVPFAFGFGGQLGDGTQPFPYISRRDAIGALLHLLDHDVEGPVNLVAPEPADNRALTRTLAKVMRRPALFPVPAFAIRLGAGAEMADEMLLRGAVVRPKVLEASGYRFADPTLEAALRSGLAGD